MSASDSNRDKHCLRSILETIKPMVNPMMTFSHLVEISEQARRLKVHRVYDDGRKELFTEVALPSTTCEEDKTTFEEFCRRLGENLLIDSPVARKLLAL